jgi:hypothetical protein
MTTKLYPEGQVGGATFSFGPADNTMESLDKYWDAIALYNAGMEPFVDSGATLLYELLNTTIGTLISAPNTTEEEIRGHLEYITSYLTENNIPFSLTTSSDTTYFDHYSRLFGPLPDGIYEVSHLIGGRLIPRTVVENNNTALTQAYRNTVASGEWVIGNLALNAGGHGSVNDNAVNPAWRGALFHTLVLSVWDWNIPRSEMADRVDYQTNVAEPSLVALSPDSATYLNEANFNMKNNQVEFYGPNLERLRAIKKRYDPESLFYALTAVGNEAWTQVADGRLCRA